MFMVFYVVILWIQFWNLKRALPVISVSIVPRNVIPQVMVLAVLKDAIVTPVITSMDVVWPYLHEVKMHILSKKRWVYRCRFHMHRSILKCRSFHYWNEVILFVIYKYSIDQTRIYISTLGIISEIISIFRYIYIFYASQIYQ